MPPEKWPSINIPRAYLRILSVPRLWQLLAFIYRSFLTPVAFIFLPNSGKCPLNVFQHLEKGRGHQLRANLDVLLKCLMHSDERNMIITNCETPRKSAYVYLFRQCLLLSDFNRSLQSVQALLAGPFLLISYKKDWILIYSIYKVRRCTYWLQNIHLKFK